MKKRAYENPVRREGVALIIVLAMLTILLALALTVYLFPGQRLNIAVTLSTGWGQPALQARVDAGTLQVYFIHLNHSNPALSPTSAARKKIEARGFHIGQRGLDLPL